MSLVFQDFLSPGPLKAREHSETRLLSDYLLTKAGSQQARIALSRLMRFRDGKDIEEKTELPQRRNGRASAKAQKISPEDLCVIRQMVERGCKPSQIAKEVNLPQATVFARAKQFGYIPTPKIEEDELVRMYEEGRSDRDILRLTGCTQSWLTTKKSLLRAEGRIK